ncbi:hypothetical protein ABZ896_31850 [Streptomyces sp. NPDC047072]|uniref:hypothetical protein n=1 Tax=Streptomyces sp. NPDC047072 TaxID=3154809 RepID=UPI0033CE7B59
MTEENTTPTEPHQQPRWAWWVVGILVPLLGIVVTVVLSGSDGDDRGETNSASVAPSSSAVTDSSAPARTTPSPSKSADKVLYGPAVVEADVSEGGTVNIDLDASSPVVSKATKGSDVIYGATTGAPTLSIWNSGSNLAPLPEADPTPTAESCMEAVERNGTYNLEAHRGDRLCLLTGEGRVVYIHVLAAPPGLGIGKLDLTVWEAPAV